MKFRTKLNRQSGFTLIEIVVATALVGVLATAIINQLRLVAVSKRDANESAIINGLADRLAVELSKRNTCTTLNAFAGKSLTNTLTNIVDSEGLTIVSVGATYGKKATVGGITQSSSSASDVASVKVSTIKTAPDPGGDPNKMILTVTFSKQQGIAAAFTAPAKIDLPITVTLDTNSKITFCYSDITNSIISAIRLSCQGNGAYIDSTANPPYGACLHLANNASDVASSSANASACPAGQYIKKVELASSATPAGNRFQYTCAAISLPSCPANQVITQVNADGTLSCGYPFPNCGAGQMMVMSSSGNYVCLNTDVGCSSLYAIKGFTDTGVTCALYYPPKTCTGLVTSVSPGSVTCSAYVKPVTCPTGQFVSSVDVNGQPVCSNWINYPQTCPAGQAVYAIDTNGNILCQNLDRHTSCGGTVSTTNTFSGCYAAGGTVMNRDGGTNSFCQFNQSSCPAGWNFCPSWRYTTNANCTDTNSSCAYSVQTRWAYGSNAFVNNASYPATTNCYYWARNSGPWVKSCTGIVTGTNNATTPTIQIGCY